MSQKKYHTSSAFSNSKALSNKDITNKKKLWSLLIIFSLSSFFLSAQTLTLAEPFNEGAVLQRNANVSIWGTANPLEEISIEFQEKRQTITSDQAGNWFLSLSNLKEGGPYILKVNTTKESLQLQQIYVGEVWIAGGQSNMGWTLEKSENGKEHIAKADNPNIRFLLVPNKNYEEHRPSGDMNWRTATSEYVAPMSGVAYFFAKELQEKLGVPIGIICCYKGGTAAEVWMSRDSLLSQPTHAPIVENYETYNSQRGQEKYNELYKDYESKLRQYKDSVKQGHKKATRPQEPMGERHYKRPYGLYNTMLKRIMPYTAKGVIWYQGEANAPRAEQYQTLFPTLIQEWRSDFLNPQLPFLFVQLANYAHPAYGERPMWAELREAQLKTWQTVDNTAMVVSMDVGEKYDIHPIYKEPVGKRLSLAALNRVYGYKALPYSGPIYKKAEFDSEKATLTFDFVYDGLIHKEGGLTGFTICNADRSFVPAKAWIENGKVIVCSEIIKNPVAVRYCWANWTEGNLYNSAELPASPFRTDDFPLLSTGVRSSKY